MRSAPLGNASDGSRLGDWRSVAGSGGRDRGDAEQPAADSGRTDATAVAARHQRDQVAACVENGTRSQGESSDSGGVALWLLDVDAAGWGLPAVKAGLGLGDVPAG